MLTISLFSYSHKSIHYSAPIPALCFHYKLKLVSITQMTCNVSLSSRDAGAEELEELGKHSGGFEALRNELEEPQLQNHLMCGGAHTTHVAVST